MPVKYSVNLTLEKHSHLVNLTRRGKILVRAIERAQILLLADQEYQDGAIASITRMVH